MPAVIGGRAPVVTVGASGKKAGVFLGWLGSGRNRFASTLPNRHTGDIMGEEAQAPTGRAGIVLGSAAPSADEMACIAAHAQRHGRAPGGATAFQD